MVENFSLASATLFTGLERLGLIVPGGTLVALEVLFVVAVALLSEVPCCVAFDRRLTHESVHILYKVVL